MRKHTKFTAILLSLVLVLSLLPLPVQAAEKNTIIIQNGEHDKFVEAVGRGNTIVQLAQNAILEVQATAKQPVKGTNGVTESDGRMLPIRIAGGTEIRGNAGASISTRAPWQLTGDHVVIKDLTLHFASSTEAGSTPHREIFLAGHSLTMDGVRTNSPVGANLSTKESNLLPTVYAGQYQAGRNTHAFPMGSNPKLTVINPNETVFQAIYLGHIGGTGYGGFGIKTGEVSTDYTGKAELVLEAGTQIMDGSGNEFGSMDQPGSKGPAIQMPSGILAEKNEQDVSIVLRASGIQWTGYGYPIQGNSHTKLTLDHANYSSSYQISQVGTLTLTNQSELHINDAMQVSGQLQLEQGSTLLLYQNAAMEVGGPFVGGGHINFNDQSAQLSIRGAVTGTTTLRGLTAGTVGLHTVGEVEQHAFGVEDPDYQLIQSGGSWELVEKHPLPMLTKVSITKDGLTSLKEVTVDVRQLDGQGRFSPSLNISFQNEGGEVPSGELLQNGFYPYIVAVKTEIWTEAPIDTSQIHSWSSPIRLIHQSGPQYQLQFPKEQCSGDYTLVFYQPIAEPYTSLDEVLDLPGQDAVLATLVIHVQGGAEPGMLQIAPIPEQLWTGEAVKPEISVFMDGTVLQQGQDYGVIYAKNQDPGMASVTVTGKVGTPYAGMNKQEAFAIIRYQLRADKTPAHYQYTDGIKFYLDVTYGNAYPDQTKYIYLYSGQKEVESKSIYFDSQSQKKTVAFSPYYPQSFSMIPLGTSVVEARYQRSGPVVAALTVTINSPKLRFLSPDGNEISEPMYVKPQAAVSGSTLPQPEKPGYSFAGWYFDQTLQTPVGKSVQVQNQDVVLYAKWQKLEMYRIKEVRVSGGSIGQGPFTATVTVEQQPTAGPAQLYLAAYHQSGQLLEVQTKELQGKETTFTFENAKGAIHRLKAMLLQSGTAIPLTSSQVVS